MNNDTLLIIAAVVVVYYVYSKNSTTTAAASSSNSSSTGSSPAATGGTSNSLLGSLSSDASDLLTNLGSAISDFWFVPNTTTSANIPSATLIAASATPAGSVLNSQAGNTPAVVAQNQQRNQSGRQVNIPVNAGATVRINSQGNQFYLVIATAPVNIRPDGGDFSLYQQGTGSRSNSANFAAVEIQNPNSVAVVISLWIGFDSFIDNRLIIANALTPQVAYPTQSAPTATAVAINDLSGGVFTDINGAQWIALQRVAILIFNTDSATTLYLQKQGAATASGPAVGVIYPLTPIRFDFSGNYALSVGGGTIPAIVSEIYIAVAYVP